MRVTNKTDANNYRQNRTVCKSCNRKSNRKDNNNNTLTPNQDTTIEADNKTKNRTLIIGFFNCGNTYLMNYILLQKQEPIFIITKPINQYRNIKAQTSDKIQALENYENRTVVFDDMLLSKQESNIDLFFKRGRHNDIDIYDISQIYFHLTKNTFRISSNIIVLFKQTLRDIILLFHDTAGLSMNLNEWKQLFGLRK